LGRQIGVPELPDQKRLPATVFLAAIRRATVEMVPRVLAIGLFAVGLGASAALGVALILMLSGHPGGPGPEGSLACSALLGVALGLVYWAIRLMQALDAGSRIAARPTTVVGPRGPSTPLWDRDLDDAPPSTARTPEVVGRTASPFTARGSPR
jgi:hypothetical protein